MIMKKQYVTPKMEVYETDGFLLLDGSNQLTTSGSYGLKYGGVDEYGELDPE